MLMMTLLKTSKNKNKKAIKIERGGAIEEWLEKRK